MQQIQSKQTAGHMTEQSTLSRANPREACYC
jgi:hypothetical protein